MYKKRHIEDMVTSISKMFGAVIVTGPRQIGKTTVLKEVTKGINYVTLDDPINMQLAVTEAGTFFKNFPPPVFVDEVQYSPELFPYIKMHIDKEKKKGEFFLSRGQQFHMMKNVTESLAGRIGILNLLGFSLRETFDISFNKPFTPNEKYFNERAGFLKKYDYKGIWDIIHRGSMPELVTNPDFDWQTYYSSYVKTYIERDVRELTQIGDEVKFLKFMTTIASISGQLLNLAMVSREVGISAPTAERWLSILKTSGIIYILEPYYNNLIKRVVKTPKVYFLDTGLMAYLTRWPNSETMGVGAQAGSFFETFVVSEIIKSYYNAGIIDPPIYFYRDKEQNEIDILIYEGDTLYPVEIKKYADPKKEDILAFNLIDKISNIKRGPGGIICM